VPEHVLHVIVEDAKVRNEVADVRGQKIFLNNFIDSAFQSAEVLEKIVNRTALLAAQDSMRGALYEAQAFRIGFQAGNQSRKKLW
jgi:hypothetical protein